MAVKKAAPAKKAAAPKKAEPKKSAPAAVAAKKAAAPAKAAASAKPASADKPIADKQTKSQIIAAIAEETNLSKKQVSEVFDSLGGLIRRHMGKKGSGEFTIPEAGVKLRRVLKPARKARKMISPFNGQEITVPARKASNAVKVTALKGLKESIG